MGESIPFLALTQLETKNLQSLQYVFSSHRSRGRIRGTIFFFGFSRRYSRVRNGELLMDKDPQSCIEVRLARAFTGNLLMSQIGL